MVDIRPINNTVPVEINSVNSTETIETTSRTSKEDVSVESTKYWYEQSKYYAGLSANSAAQAEAAKNSLLSDTGFIAVSEDLANINIVANDITNVNIIANMITENDNLLFYEEIE